MVLTFKNNDKTRFYSGIVLIILITFINVSMRKQPSLFPSFYAEINTGNGEVLICK